MTAVGHVRPSLAEYLAAHPEERKAFLASLTPDQAAELQWSWRFWGRPSQQPPVGNWRIWLLLAGRGYGKTRSDAEWVRAEIEAGKRGRLALVAPTAADVRDVVVEGPAGILATARSDFRPLYEPSRRRLVWPNGAIAMTFSADEPDRLRGPQHDGFWADEIAAWRYPESWDNLLLSLRLGTDPRGVAATTPKPVRVIRDLLADKTCVVTRGTTFENVANLSTAFIREIVGRYEGTMLGRQELYAEVLSEMPGALWTRERIEKCRVAQAPPLTRIVVAIDPSVTSGVEAAETGIVVAGIGENGHGYVLEDLSCRASPDQWASQAVMAYHKHRADQIVAEVNNGGEMVEHVIRTVDPAVPFRAVHASRGKVARAEPVAALYEQGRVHHVGMFPDLESQMVMHLPGGVSPDRMDALVWALTDLLVGQPFVDLDAIDDAMDMADRIFGKVGREPGPGDGKSISARIERL